MGSVVVYSHRDSIPATSVGGSGGGMDNSLARVGAVEVAVSDIRNQVTVISATVPSLATKAELAAVHASLKEDITTLRTELTAGQSTLKEDIACLKATIPHLATKDYVATLRTEFRTGQSALKEDISSLKATIPHLATKADLGVLETKIEAMGTKIAVSEVKLIQWIVGTGISSTALAVSLIKLIH